MQETHHLKKIPFLLGFVIIINGVSVNIIFNKVFGFIKDIINFLVLNTFSGDTIAFGDFLAFSDFLTFSDFLAITPNCVHLYW